MSWLSPDDLTRWQHGTAFESYRHLGAHPLPGGGVQFTVWAPHAEYVWVIGDFNGWQAGVHRLEWRDGGLWTGSVAEAQPGQHYKFRVQRGGYRADKSDPYAFAMEAPSHGGNPIAGLSGIVTDLAYDWHDADWMRGRPDAGTAMKRPMSVYEVHLGSWKRKPDGSVHSYREIAEPLADHVAGLGFTHVELMPVLEHPYYGSWGYQVVGYYAPTHRYGSPQDFMHLVDVLHQRGIGVLLDWVPAHFATDPQGLVFFDGSTLFEYDDPSMRAHPDWGTYVFDYAKPGVQNFLVSNALFWLDKYHIDGLRFDAVASMLYRDYSRQQWTPNQYGGRENLEAIHLLKTVNEQVYSRFPSALTVAEESTSWPGVSAPTFNGGLGFGYKWNMGWMHDTLEYFSADPIARKYQHNNLTFPLMYAFSEHFVLPLSHDEVVHLKGSLWEKMPGDDWQKAANLRLLYTHMVGHPGKLLLFMGAEFGQTTEWNHDIELPWWQASEPLHEGLSTWLHDLLHLYRDHPALHDDSDAGFQWIDFGDRQQSVVSYIRRGRDAEGNLRTLVFALNLTPVPRPGYAVGVPEGGTWRVVLGSDGERYGGSGITAHGQFQATGHASHGQPDALSLDLPPLGALVLERVTEAEPAA